MAGVLLALNAKKGISQEANSSGQRILPLGCNFFPDEYRGSPDFGEFPAAAQSYCPSRQPPSQASGDAAAMPGAGHFVLFHEDLYNR